MSNLTRIDWPGKLLSALKYQNIPEISQNQSGVKASVMAWNAQFSARLGFLEQAELAVRSSDPAV